jgi:hypothetical protein
MTKQELAYRLCEAAGALADAAMDAEEAGVEFDLEINNADPGQIIDVIFYRDPDIPFTMADDTLPLPTPMTHRTNAPPMVNADPTILMQVYLDDGRVFEYEVATAAQAQEHTSAIARTGYVSVGGGTLTHFPAHRIQKVKATGPGLSTNYTDRVRGI